MEIDGDRWREEITIGTVPIREFGIRLHANRHRFGAYLADMRHHEGRNGARVCKLGPFRW